LEVRIRQLAVRGEKRNAAADALVAAWQRERRGTDRCIPMLRRATAATLLVGFAASVAACAIETSGMLSTGHDDASSDGGAASAGKAPDAASTSPGRSALTDGMAVAADAGVGMDRADGRTGADGGPVLGSAQSGPDGSVPSTSSDGALPIDGGFAGIDGPVEAGTLFACGGYLQCESPSQVCCMSSSSRNKGPNAVTCEDGAVCSDPSATLLRCSSAADCAPQVCCLSQQSSQPTSQCSAQCNGGGVPLCDPSAQSTGCASGTACTTSQNRGSGPLPSGVGTCN
jgi:hypothetical protein